MIESVYGWGQLAKAILVTGLGFKISANEKHSNMLDAELKTYSILLILKSLGTFKIPTCLITQPTWTYLDRSVGRKTTLGVLKNPSNLAKNAKFGITRFPKWMTNLGLYSAEPADIESNMPGVQYNVLVI